MLWPTHITCQRTQQRPRPFWASYMVAALKEVQVLEGIPAWQEAQYLEGSGVRGWEELAFHMRWQLIETG